MSLFDPYAGKRPANLSVNSDLLTRAKGLDINLSSTFEKALIEEVKAAATVQWKEDNKQGIDRINHFTEQHGLISDTLGVL